MMSKWDTALVAYPYNTIPRGIKKPLEMNPALVVKMYGLIKLARCLGNRL
jgi:hypothetical protein